MLKVSCIFSLERRLPDLSSCHIWSFLCEVDSTMVPFHPWQKYEWSCCQTGTEVLAVSAASAGRMSKRSVWINDFSRGLIGTDRCKGTALSPCFLLLFFFTRIHFGELVIRSLHCCQRQKDAFLNHYDCFWLVFREVRFVCPNCMKRRFIFNQLQSRSVSRERRLVCGGVSKEFTVSKDTFLY